MILELRSHIFGKAIIDDQKTIPILAVVTYASMFSSHNSILPRITLIGPLPQLEGHLACIAEFLVRS